MNGKTVEELDKYYYDIETKIQTALSEFRSIEAPFKMDVSIDLELIESVETGYNKKYIFARPKINATWRR